MGLVIKRGLRMNNMFINAKKAFICAVILLSSCVVIGMDRPAIVRLSDSSKENVIEVPRDIAQLSKTVAGMISDLGHIGPNTVIPIGNYSIDTIKTVFGVILPVYKLSHGSLGVMQQEFKKLSFEALIDIVNAFEFLNVPKDLSIAAQDYLLSIVRQMPIADIARKERLSTINRDLLGDCINETIDCLKAKIIKKTFSKDKIVVLHEQANSEISALQFSPDGSKIACISQSGSMHSMVSKLIIWNVDMISKLIKVDLPFEQGVSVMMFSPDNTKIAAGSFDAKDNFILCDARTGEIKKLYSYNDYDYLKSIAFSPDSKKIVAANSDLEKKGNLIFWDVDTGKSVVHDYPNPGLHSVLFNPNGLQVVSVDENNIVIWNAHTGTIINSFSGYATSENCIVFSPNGSAFVSMGGGNEIKKDFLLCDLNTYGIKKLDDIQKDVMSVVFSPDNAQFVSGAKDLRDSSNLILWDAKNGSVIKNFHDLDGTVHLLAFNKKGTNFVAGSDGQRNNLMLYDVNTGKKIKLEGHKGGLHSLEFCSDNITIISGSKDNMIIWDSNTGVQRLNLNISHNKLVCSPNGKAVVLQTKTRNGVRLSFLPLITGEELENFNDIATYSSHDILLLNALCTGQLGPQELDILSQFPIFIQEALKQ